MSWEPISPELALVDPDLGARARAALPAPSPPIRAARPLPPARRPAPSRDHRAYPFWARVTAALWLVVLGILIGGAAIPHAQEKPRVIPRSEDQRYCPGTAARPQPAPSVPGRFGGP